MGSPSITVVVGVLIYRFRTESSNPAPSPPSRGGQGSRVERECVKEAGGSFQLESYLPKEVPPLQEGRALSPPHPHKQEASAGPSPAGRSRTGRATEPWAVTGSGQCRAVCSASVGEPGPSAVLPRLTHSIKEVSELVLFKTGSQKVTWGLQDALFEPEGGGLGLTRNASGAQLCWSVPPALTRCPSHTRGGACH